MKKTLPAKKKLSLNVTSLVDLQGARGGGLVTSLFTTVGAPTTSKDVPSEKHYSCTGCPKTQLCL